MPRQGNLDIAESVHTCAARRFGPRHLAARGPKDGSPKGESGCCVKYTIAFGFHAAVLSALLVAAPAGAATLTLENPFGLPDNTFGYDRAGIRFTPFVDVTLDSVVFVYAGLADMLMLRLDGSASPLASVAVAPGAAPTIGDLPNLATFEYVWSLGVSLQAGMTYELASVGRSQLSSSFLLTNANHGFRAPESDFNAHLDIVAGFFDDFVSSEHWVGFDRLVTTDANASPAPEPGALALFALAVAGLAGLRRRG